MDKFDGSGIHTPLLIQITSAYFFLASASALPILRFCQRRRSPRPKKRMSRRSELEAELARLKGDIDRQQTMLRQTVFGAATASEAVAEVPSSSRLVRKGMQWTGTVGCDAFHLVFSFRNGSWVEAIGIWPGQGAARIEGSVLEVRLTITHEPAQPAAACAELPAWRHRRSMPCA